MRDSKKKSPISFFLSPSFLFSVLLTCIVAMPLVSAAVTVGRDVTLQWDESIDSPNLQSYRIYYYTTQGVVGSLNSADCAASYSLPGGGQIPINPLSDPKSITIDKSYTQITLHALDTSKQYYFAATAVDKQGLESVYTPEVYAPATPQPESYVTFTVTSVPVGRQVVVDGVTYTTPQVLNWIPGTNHTIGMTSPQPGSPGTRYVYQGWSDQGNQSHTVTAPQTAQTYTVTFVTQHALTGSVSPADAGTLTLSPAALEVEGGRSWYSLNQMVTATAAPANAEYVFTGWTGSTVTPAAGAIPQGGASGTLAMDGPKSLTADFAKALGYTVTSVPVGRRIVVDGSTYTTPKVFNWIPGTSHTIGVTSPQSGAAGARYVFKGWSDQGNQSHTVTAPATTATYTVTFETTQRALMPFTSHLQLLLSDER